MNARHYDFQRRRWMARPQGLRWSEMVLGRRATQARVWETGEATVSAYRFADGRVFYSDPVIEGSAPGPGVLYRIRVRLKAAQVPT
jgi:hypothetical protein